ncbi:hypothetical protein GOP47_0027535 [Adiantum capillus-veneris]|nr:hypothetical protein GOP47_0027535 [Adiantum capillus-veneris]
MFILSSCFLICMKDDSIEGIYDTLKECAIISKSAGDMWIKVEEKERVPSLFIWNHGMLTSLIGWTLWKGRGWGRDLFYGLWMLDLFMKRVQDNGLWSLFCPNEAPGLADCWGEEFETLYFHYEIEGRAKRKSRQGILRWCTRMLAIAKAISKIWEPQNCPFSAQRLWSLLALRRRFVREKGVPLESHPSKLVGSRGYRNRYFDFEKLGDVAAVATCNLNKIIDVNNYPVETAY